MGYLIVFAGVVIIGFLFILWAYTGGLMAQTTVKLKPYKGDVTDPGGDQDLHDAYWYALWATVVTWVLIGLILILGIVLIIGAIFFFPEEAVGLNLDAVGGFHALSLLIYGVAFILLLMSAINGVLASLALKSLLQSPAWDPTNEDLMKARNDLLITSVVSLGLVGLVIAFFVAAMIAAGIKSNAKSAKKAGIK